MSNIKERPNIYKKETKKKTNSFFLKIIAIIGLLITSSLFIFFQINSQYQIEKILEENEVMFENSIPLLAVNEINGEISSASTIPLTLRVTRGNGNIFINLNSYTELDTQISITNSQNTICTLLQLPCQKYDFYYTFNGASLILRGPSASTSLGVLTYATINNITLDDSFALTGNLNSNGIVGRVGGTFEKVQEANRRNIQRVYVPFNSLNQTQIEEINALRNIEVIQNLDIISILENEFPQKNININQEPFSTELYSQTMNYIAQELCALSQIYIEELTTNNLINDSFISNSLNQYNFSKVANENSEFYSQGSFCYSANIGFKTLLNLNFVQSSINSTHKNMNTTENETLEQLIIEIIENEITEIQLKIDEKKEHYNPQTFPRTLNNLNDIFVYLLVQNRIFEAQEFLDESQNLLEEFENLSLNNSQNISSNNQSNSSYNSTINIRDNRELFLSIQQLSLAQERFTTVEQWESVFGSSTQRDAQLRFSRAQEICRLYISDTSVLNQILLQFSIDTLTPRVQSLEDLFQDNPYLCIFNGMQLKGQMNSILSGSIVSSNTNQSELLIEELQRIALQRMQFKSQGELPLIPYISYEYSKTLQEVGNLQSALQYVQLALSYSELNILLSNSQTNPSSQFNNLIFGSNDNNFYAKSNSYNNAELTQYQKQKIQEIKQVQYSSYIFILLSFGFIFYLIKN
ncbi:MAG: hypothetical protein LAT82_04085 [Nanoarchaeota archaeon]|nr:hypothetical protein [Nanoarchaeota archaeon]